MNRAKLNYWVDVAIGVAGLISAVSGLVFLLPVHGEVLGLSLRAWSTIHTWSSLAVIAGVGIHLALHGKWIVAMTQRGLFLRSQQVAGCGSELVPVEAATSSLSRRTFLIAGGLMTIATGLAVLGYRTIANAVSTQDRQSAPSPLESEPSGGVACPFGLVNDPYPGQCPRYTDLDGDGICDYSVPASGDHFSGLDDEPSQSDGSGLRKRFRRRGS